MLELPQVTLVAVSGIGYQTNGIINAIQYSQREIKYGEVLYIQSGSIKSIDDWNYYIIYHLHEHIKTDYCLLVHENGFVVNAKSWNPAWLRYDYVGAPWPLPSDDYSYRTPEGELIRVGNSVSLRSKRILEAPTRLNFPWRSFYGNTNEDGFLCVHHRWDLESRGMVFAPLEVAAYFSRELDIPENAHVTEPFCFHLNRVLPGRNEEYRHLIKT